MKNKEKIGSYKPFKQRKNADEAFIKDIKDGELFWTVKIAEGHYYDTKSQDVAEILSGLVRIENMLRKRRK